MRFYDNDIIVYKGIISSYGAIKRSVSIGEKVRFANTLEIELYNGLLK